MKGAEIEGREMSKKEKGLMDMTHGDCWGEGGIRGLKGNVKKYNNDEK